MIFETLTVVGAAIAAKRYLFKKKKEEVPPARHPSHPRWVLSGPRRTRAGDPTPQSPAVGSLVIMEMIDGAVQRDPPGLQGCFRVVATSEAGFSAHLLTIRSVNARVDVARLPPIGLRVDDVPPMFVR